MLHVVVSYIYLCRQSEAVQMDGYVFVEVNGTDKPEIQIHS